MATTPSTRATALARRMRIDIDTGTYPTVSYEQLYGVEEFKPVIDSRTESDETYDDDGAMREMTTGYSWRLEIKLKHSTNAAGDTLDTLHAFLKTMFLAASRDHVNLGEFGVRWYDREGLEGDSHEGRAYVKAWPPDGGGGGAPDTISLVIQGQGPLADIDNPVGDLDPVVSSVSPTTGTTAGGTLVKIYGWNFTGVTGAAGVKFGANNATSYTLVNDGLIVAVAPAGAAATVQTIVTTPEGTSANVAGDNYTYA